MIKTGTISTDVIFVSLANTSIFKTYNIGCVDDMCEAYEDFNLILDKIGEHDTDIELQVSDSENNITDSNVDYLMSYMTIAEEEEIDLDLLVALHKYYNNLDDVINIIENTCYSIQVGEGLHPELDAFIKYCDEIEVFAQIPSHLETYIDYEKYYRDCRYSGMTILELNHNEWIYISY